MSNKIRRTVSAALISFLYKSDRVEYIVRADDYEGGEYKASFVTRANARAYKRALKDSVENIASTITKNEWSDGYLVSSKVVS